MLMQCDNALLHTSVKKYMSSFIVPPAFCKEYVGQFSAV